MVRRTAEDGTVPSNYSLAEILQLIVDQQRRGYAGGSRPAPDGTTVRPEMNYMGATPTLRERLERQEGPCSPGHEVHHIVPVDMPEADKARQVLEKAKIGIDDRINGICLPRNISTPNPDSTLVHTTMHTLEYCRYINRLLSKAYELGGRKGVKAALAQLKINIYEASVHMPGGEPIVRGRR